MSGTTRKVLISSRAYKSESRSERSHSLKGENSNESSSKLDIDSFVSAIRSMKPLVHVPQDKLDEEMKNKLKLMRESAYMIRKSKSYIKIVNAIKETFGEFSDIKPLTIGAFFYGCFINSNYEGLITCSNLCSGSIPVPDVPGTRDCATSVAVTTESGLVLTYFNQNSSEVLIHADKEFAGISQKEAEMLQSKGITSAILSIEGGSKSSRSSGSVSDFVSKCYDSFSNSEEECKKEALCDLKRREEPKDCGSWGFFAAILLVVFLIVVAVMVYVFFWSKSSCEEEKEQQCPRELHTSMMEAYS